MAENTSRFGCLMLFGFLFLSGALGVGIHLFQEYKGKNVSHSQDESRFDPILAKDEVTALAGPGVQFHSLRATHVRPDGTQDFTNSGYEPMTLYQFLAPLNQDLPLGASPNRVSVVFISVRPKGWESHWRAEGEYQYTYNFGLKRWIAPSSVSTDGSAFPKCSLEEIWKGASAAGAPEKAVASIDFQDNLYRFSIVGTQYNYVFDQNCKLAKN